VTKVKSNPSKRKYLSPASSKEVCNITISDIDVNPELPKNQQLQLKKLLRKFTDIFAQGLKNVGIVNTEPYRIDTGTSKLVKQRPRKTSQFNKKFTRDKVQELLKADIIKPCKEL